MEEDIDNNKIIEEDNELEVFEFKCNFISQPWDDRSNKSKFGIAALLIGIFVLTMSLVINNFSMHYRNYGLTKYNNEINCLRARLEDYPYVARIHSASSKQLLCVGAVISHTSILANGVCVRSGPIRVHLGNPTFPQCKKGFTVDVIETVYHDGIISNKLALLSSFEDISKCSKAVKIGKDINLEAKALIIGRPTLVSRSLSKQYISLINKESMPNRFKMKSFKQESMICVKDLSRCPVMAGDLLLQNGYLHGIASTSVHRSDVNQMACFADLNIVRNELHELDEEIT